MTDALPIPSTDSVPPPWLSPLLDRLDRLTATMERTVPSIETTGEWLSAAELANLLGVSLRSIRSWELLGKLPPPVRVGRLKKWKKATVEHHLSRRS